MTIQLTERMRNWIEACGCHLCVASPAGVPNVVMARCAAVKEDEVFFGLTKDEAATIRPEITENPWVAFGVSHVGGVRAAYQFKGTGKMVTEGPVFDSVAPEANKALSGQLYAVLVVKLTEVYCTKPGHVAGTRMDTAPISMEKFEEDLGWKDLAPPKKT